MHNSNIQGEVPASGVIPVAQMKGEDDEETIELRELFERARNYVESFSWCDSIVDSYFAGGVGRIFAIFLIKINSNRWDVDPWEWIFVGDVPSAYMPLEDAASKLAAFENYLEGMSRWVAKARRGTEPAPEDNCPPVNVPATSEWADHLESRLRLLDEHFRPCFE